MDLNILQSTLFGFVSGLMDILPVSAQAHKVLLFKFFGFRGQSGVLELLIDLAICAALFYTSQAHLTRMNRARKLARVPKKKRKRPLDTKSLMDFSLLKTMCVPAIIGLVLYQYTPTLRNNLVTIAIFLFLNGMILYIPQFFPTGNRDSRTLSRIEGLLIGLAGAVSVIPGISAVGTSASVSSICGVDKKYSLTMVLMLNMVLTAGYVVYDLLGIIDNGLGVITIGILLRYLISAISAFAGTMLGIGVLRKVFENQGLSVFGVYCWGVALFMFILNLMA